MLLELFETQAHFGHQRKYRTPQLRPSIYKSVNQLDIINLDITIQQIDIAKKALLNFKDSSILLVSERSIEETKVNIVNLKILPKWKSGYISNFDFGKLDVIPALVIVDKVAYQYNLIKECKKAKILVIGFCDTNTPFSIYKDIDYPIVINDDSNEAIKLLLNNLL